MTLAIEGGGGKVDGVMEARVQTYRGSLKGVYVVARIFFLLLLNCSAWPCLGPAQQDLHTYLFPSVFVSIHISLPPDRKWQQRCSVAILENEKLRETRV